MLSGHSIAASWADEMGDWTFSSKCPYCWFVSWPDWIRTETCGSISAQLAVAFVPLCRHGVLARGIAGLLMGEGWGEHTHVHTKRMTLAGWADEERRLLCLLRAVWRALYVWLSLARWTRQRRCLAMTWNNVTCWLQFKKVDRWDTL